jgi:hypothetical protein
MTRATYTSELTWIPRSQEIDSSGLGERYFLTPGSKGVFGCRRINCREGILLTDK